MNARFLTRFLPFSLLAALAIAAVNGAAIAPTAAMVGGAPPAQGNVRNSVVTILSSYGTFCTATAITRDLLLTAATLCAAGRPTISSPTPYRAKCQR